VWRREEDYQEKENLLCLLIDSGNLVTNWSRKKTVERKKTRHTSYK
jgi:hypothetical protein